MRTAAMGNRWKEGRKARCEIGQIESFAPDKDAHSNFLCRSHPEGEDVEEGASLVRHCPSREKGRKDQAGTPDRKDPFPMAGDENVSIIQEDMD